MIDLSFLTDDEQEAILAVLKRDAELKKAEEKRVQRLQQMVEDKGQLKYLTGEWFYETKQLRHQERIHGSDIIWASMKHTHKPITILELSQMMPERPSFVSSENQDVFVPAVLSGLLQEPRTPPGNSWDHVENTYEQVTSKPLSPTKRINPFNSGPEEPACTEDTEQPSQTTQQSPYSQTEEYILPTDLVNPFGPLQNLGPTYLIDPISPKSPLQPVPEENITSITNDYINEMEDLSNDAAPRGILKSDPVVLDEQKSTQAESPTEQWIDKKQVRFIKRNDGKEVGEHSLLDVDSFTPQEEERKEAEHRTEAEDGAKPKSEVKSTDSEVAMQEGSQEEVTNDQTEKYQSQSSVPSLISAVLESHEAVHVENQPEEDHTPPITEASSLIEAHLITEKKLTNEISKKSSHAVSPSAKQRLLGFFKRDKTKSTETKKQKPSENEDKLILQDEAVVSVEAPLQITEDREKSTPELNTSSENTGSKIEVNREEVLQITKTESLQITQANLHTQNVLGNVSGSENDVEIVAKSDEDSQCKPLLESSNEDGTYRAFPVLIYEDNEDSIVCSVPETQIIELNSKPSPVVIPKQLSYIPQDDKPANVVELKNFWEECSGGRASAPCSPVHSSKGSSVGSPLKTAGSQKKPDPISPSKIITVKSVIVNDKGFVSQSSAERSQEAPQSPTRSPTKRSKEQYDEVKRSPSKTCHPRVLPRETASPEGSRPASPLKTFPIVIDTDEKPRQKKSPSPEGKSNLENTETNYVSPLARSVISQDYEHYLGPHDKAHVPPFQSMHAEEIGDQNRPQSPLREFVANQSGNKDPRVSSWIEQIKDCSDDTSTKAWSLARASSGNYGEKSGPVMSALKRLSSKMSSSKSLEDLTTSTREEKEHMNRSVDDVSEMPSADSFATSKKSSASVPAFQLDETDSDSPFENNMSWRRNTGSSTSNVSLSSGMASMSSVSGSMTSIYHADLGDVDVQGTIQFAVNYIQKLGEFHIFVVHCRGLALGDAKKSRSDPYVKCYLLPDKTKLGKRKTSIKKKTVNPTYNEILRFKILLEVLKSQHLNVSVWHNDTFGRNSFLGEVDLDLSEWDFSNAQINEYALKARSASSALTSTPSPTRSVDSRGQMRVALRFLPQTSPSKRKSRNETGEVQIWVKDCKNLPPIRGVIIDPFVKCTVLPDTSRKSRQKTRVVKRTANPMFNHTMVYDGFRPEDLREACVELTVWDHDRLNNHYIGGVRLGLGTGKSYGVDVNWMDSTTSEAHLWKRMLESDGEWVEEILPLRMLLMAKSMAK
ncbi:synaptotagmin-like protein 2 isoform X2 [Boleophthalmus pectinirostris]|uniref:synaptotagmin-like protein 2 isoform X2 n=1 Tax=Boleophthalmus pectinirostris TaxID=150288 RepID=UPI00242DEE07|nr:synaptotagmin-like protein 2 isoform X2 [Boleophthalmus pectinirostris]